MAHNTHGAPSSTRGRVGFRGYVSAEQQKIVADQFATPLSIFELEFEKFNNKRRTFKKLRGSYAWEFGQGGVTFRRRRKRKDKDARGRRGRGRRRRARRQRVPGAQYVPYPRPEQTEYDAALWSAIGQAVLREAEYVIPEVRQQYRSPAYPVPDAEMQLDQLDDGGDGDDYDDDDGGSDAGRAGRQALRPLLRPPAPADPVEKLIQRTIHPLRYHPRRLRFSPGGLALSSFDSIFTGGGMRFAENLEEIVTGDPYIYIDSPYETARYSVVEPAVKDEIDRRFGKGERPGSKRPFGKNLRKRARDLYRRATKTDPLEEILRIGLTDSADGQVARTLLESVPYRSIERLWGQRLGPSNLRHILGGAAGNFVYASARSASYVANLPVRFNRGVPVPQAISQLKFELDPLRFGITDPYYTTRFIDETDVLLRSTKGDVYRFKPGSFRHRIPPSVHIHYRSERLIDWAQMGFRRRSQVALGGIEFVHVRTFGPHISIAPDILGPNVEVQHHDVNEQINRGREVTTVDEAVERLQPQAGPDRTVLVETSTGAVVEVKPDSVDVRMASPVEELGDAMRYSIIDHERMNAEPWRDVPNSPRRAYNDIHGDANPDIHTSAHDTPGTRTRSAGVGGHATPSGHPELPGRGGIIPEPLLGIDPNRPRAAVPDAGHRRNRLRTFRRSVAGDAARHHRDTLPG